MAKRQWRLIPVPPTKGMLLGMANATFLNDNSLLEMERRFNGMLDEIPKRKRAVNRKPHAQS